MKKNTMMRIASCLLVAVLLTTCAISGTYAKYTTEISMKDTARVAYWGFKAQTDVDLKLFEYTDAGVASGNTDRIIAPGTSNEVDLDFIYSDYSDTAIAAPEVDYSLDVAVVVTGTVTELETNENFKWTLTTAGGTEEFDTLAALETKLESYSTNYEAGALPEIFKNGVKVGWVWDFEVDDAGNAADTDLGNMDALEEFTLTITITAAQLNG